MSDLLLAMNELTFDQLVELGRSVIPTLAPKWTDHNAHDPGIMLIELLSWIAEAQMYSISHTRRDEREGYARLLGIEAQGPQAASGFIWPYVGNGAKDAPAIFWRAGLSIPQETLVTSDRSDAPDFYTAAAIQLTTAELARVETLFASGSSRDWTRVNTQEGATFMPFGDAPAYGDRLVLTFEIDADQLPNADTPLSIGFDIINDEPKIASPDSNQRQVRVSLSDAAGTRRVDVVNDSTHGLLKSGVLLLSIGDLEPEQIDPGSDAKPTFTITLQSATGGFARSPRVHRIGVNVIPVVQEHTIPESSSLLQYSLPNQQYALQEEGLIYPSTTDDVFSVQLTENSQKFTWNRKDDLQNSGPEDRDFVLDVSKGVITFGNGLNGKRAPDNAEIQVTYQVSDGSQGNLPIGVKWSVKGLAGIFGINREVTAGGHDAQTLDDLRVLAREESRITHPLITTSDLKLAALSFVDLGVKRAIEIAPAIACPQPRGSRVLVVVGPHDDDGILGTESTAEAPEFLQAVQSRLVPRVPLGQRLEVVGPVYVPVRITATLIAKRNTNPAIVQAKVVQELQKRLAIVTENGLNEWPFGRGVSLTTVKGWLRKVEGVASVASASLFGSGSSPVESVDINQMSLPQLQVQAQDITVNRSPEGSTQ